MLEKYFRQGSHFCIDSKCTSAIFKLFTEIFFDKIPSGRNASFPPDSSWLIPPDLYKTRKKSHHFQIENGGFSGWEGRSQAYDLGDMMKFTQPFRFGFSMFYRLIGVSWCSQVSHSPHRCGCL